MDLTAAPGTFEARWCDPRGGAPSDAEGGAPSDAEGGTPTGGTIVVSTPPDSRDWARSLDRT